MFACLGDSQKNLQYLSPQTKFKNPLNKFFGLNMRSLYGKLQPSSFQTEEGVSGDRRTKFLSLLPPFSANHIYFSKPSKPLAALLVLGD